MSNYLYAFLLLFTISANNAQEVKGIVYDDESTVKGAQVLNISQQIVTATDDKGEFEINAKVNDTLYFQSTFHKPKFLIVNEDYFENTYVFELKKVINQLDVVNIKDKPQEKLFEEDAFNENQKRIIAIDKKKEPQKYTAAPKYGVDFIQIFGMIGKLFKKKKKDGPKTLTYNQLKALFDTNNFFNQKLLREDLKIKKEQQSLFFEFCEAKGVLESLLNYKQRLQLLNTFMLYSEEFLLVIELSNPKK